MERKKRFTAFWGGLACGLLLSVAVVLILVFVASRQTYVVRINTNSFSTAMEGPSHYLLENSIPDFLETYKEIIPELVSSRTENQFDNAKLSLGGISFDLPDEFVQQLELNYRDSVVHSMHELLDSLSISELSDELGSEISETVIGAIYAQYNQQTIYLELFNGVLQIPVRIELVDLPGEQDIRLIFAPTLNDRDY